MTPTSERYANIKKVFEENADKILEDSKISKVPNTCKMLFNSQRKIDELISALEVLVINKQAYAINAIMRIIYEHYIVAHYVWLKSDFGKSDDCAIEYYEKYLLGENLKRLGHDLAVEGIIKGIEQNNSPTNKLKITAKFNIFQPQIDEAHRIQNQFEVKNILRYILTFKIGEHPFREHHEQFPFYLNQYNHLSSYVHGGPSSENEIFNLPDQLIIERTLRDNITHAQIACEAIKLHILFLLIEYDTFYAKLLKPIMEEKKASN
jgi:hypothetical protein